VAVWFILLAILVRHCQKLLIKNRCVIVLDILQCGAIFASVISPATPIFLCPENRHTTKEMLRI
jgi:hypothetical protein